MDADAIPAAHAEVADIAFKDVHFSYPSRIDVPVLKSVSFDLQPGKTLALVGRSGSGKSTIASLLMRFYTVDTGEVTVGNASLSAIDLKAWRGALAFVPQDVLLFGGSIRENIAYGDTQASEEQIIEAAKQANAGSLSRASQKASRLLLGSAVCSLVAGSANVLPLREHC